MYLAGKNKLRTLVLPLLSETGPKFYVAAEAVCSFILRPQVLVRESNSQSPAFQSNAPPHELVLPPPDRRGQEDLFF